MLLNTPEFPNCESDEMLARGVDPTLIGAAMKATTLTEIGKIAENTATRIDPLTANRLALYHIKEAIAVDPSKSSEAEIAELKLEAKARGLTLDNLYKIISSQAAVLRMAILKIDRVTVEAKQAISALDDLAPELEAEIGAVIELLLASVAGSLAEIKAAL